MHIISNLLNINLMKSLNELSFQISLTVSPLV